jgi:hypothetical protein
MVAVTVEAIDEEVVNFPVVASMVPADAGLAVHATTWLGLSCPKTDAVNDWLPPAVTVAVEGLTVTEVTVVVVPPPVLPVGLPPHPARDMAKAAQTVRARVKTPRRHSPRAINTTAFSGLRMAFCFLGGPIIPLLGKK